ncbi:2-oxoglutarate dehydrogenase E1 component [Candidatus Pseudomonas adelgestsugas]|uniref:oxoglutarate dehydrogenase (succinyl-transferring) n=1 Tax=Candidatus Pseudomonas adelgestsugas TaxID=1302376 RepID=A0ABX5R8K8_9PSED|nr:2-oxoglutarate dehydrogenase E1 component [Candidatus Pseudomonas adelgestsugas]QAX81986.1 2-oxoglutarate dehydrogenase E1 component [Candidatus Pseudomonas adelgestsugas]
MQESVMQRMWNSSYLSGDNAAYVEELYELFLYDHNTVPEAWRTKFQTWSSDGNAAIDISHATIRDQFALLAKNLRCTQLAVAGGVTSDYEKKQFEVLRLIQAYRMHGHQAAQLDPLGLWKRSTPVELSINYYGLTNIDLDTVFRTGDLLIGKEEASLREIYEALQQTYCRTIGAEFTHINDSEQRYWFQHRLEAARGRPVLSTEVRSHLLECVTAAEGLEKYLGTKYPGTKRFSLEGSESLILILDELIQYSGAHGTQEIVIGMAHRGRLNVLVNIFGKNPRELFDEFEGKNTAEIGSGDVKYHQGFSSNVMTTGGEVHLAMAFNPSHLEIVSPVIEGSVRARQDRRNDSTGEKVLPISIHGDAAFSGQGVVLETLQMSQTRGFKTGGTVHIVINNQVGFTVSNPLDARSTEYATDVAKMIQASILHVNGDDPEAVLFVTQLAINYRIQFKRDVVIDLVCYRRRGHNEVDEPSGTQPLMYQKIFNQRTTRELYADSLIKSGVIDNACVQAKVDEYRNALDDGLHVVKGLVKEPNKDLFVDWRPYLGHAWTVRHNTSFDLKILQELSTKLLNIPKGFAVQRQVAKIYEDRQKMQAGSLPINWGYAEIMAYATLAFEGYEIRMTGQDIGRGTFSHRHAVLHNQIDATTYTPLQHLYDGQPRFNLYDSFLSEEAVLAFEYGYSTTAPNALVIWEAQFGDFANGAQVVIDQFITSGEHKWGRLCGLTMLLPHGYEGQGPEHSSARLERYLQLCAEHNIQVCIPTTPAQIYHLLRRQMIRPLRKPLVVLTPKSLLRHKLAISTLEDLSNGSFQVVIPENDTMDVAKVTRLILCSGKVYYDLLEKRRAEGREDIAIVRIEQLYPFPEDDLMEVSASYTNLVNAVWCQEEPMNQGAWYSSQHYLRRSIGNHKTGLGLEYAGRDASAAPACGYMSMHAEQQEKLLQDAFTVSCLRSD